MSSKPKKKPKRAHGDAFSNKGKTISKNSQELLNHAKNTYSIVAEMSSNVHGVQTTVNKNHEMLTAMSKDAVELQRKLARVQARNNRLQKRNDSLEKLSKSAAAEAKASAGKQSSDSSGVCSKRKRSDA